jgi:hypothetical protein
MFLSFTALGEEEKKVTGEQVHESVEYHSIKGEDPPKYIQQEIVKAFNSGDQSTIKAIEKGVTHIFAVHTIVVTMAVDTKKFVKKYVV